MGKVIHLDVQESSGGGGQGWEGTAINRNALPVTLGVPAIGEIYLVEKPLSETVLLIPYKTYQSGLYIRELNNGNLNDWRRLNIKTQFNDEEFNLANSSDTGKQIKFDLTALTVGFKRVVKFFDGDYFLGQVHEIEAGTDIQSIDNTNPNKPVINAVNQRGPLYSYDSSQLANQQTTNSTTGVTYTTLVSNAEIGKMYKVEIWFSISHSAQNNSAFVDIKDFGVSILPERYQIEPKDINNKLWESVMFEITPDTLSGGQFQLQLDFGTTNSNRTTTMYAAYLSLTKVEL